MYFSLEAKINAWDLWFVVRSFEDKLKIINKKFKISYLNGKNTYLIGNKFQIDYFNFELNKTELDTLDVISQEELESTKSILYKISNQETFYFLSYKIKKTIDDGCILFVDFNNFNKSNDVNLFKKSTSAYSNINNLILKEKEDLSKLIEILQNKKKSILKFHESKILKFNYLLITELMGDLKTLIDLGNKLGGFGNENQKNNTSTYTIEEDPQNSDTPQTVGNSYYVTNHIHKYKVNTTLTKFEINESGSKVSYKLNFDGINQYYDHSFKFLNSNHTYADLNLTIKDKIPEYFELLKKEELKNCLYLLEAYFNKSNIRK